LISEKLRVFFSLSAHNLPFSSFPSSLFFFRFFFDFKKKYSRCEEASRHRHRPWLARPAWSRRPPLLDEHHSPLLL